MRNPNLYKLLVLHFVLLLLFCGATEAQAQSHKKFSARIDANEREQPTFYVRPHVSDGLARDTQNWGVYGVLFCYRLNGQPRVERQDMTYKLVNGGEYTFTLAYSRDARISDFTYEFFDATQPAHTYPAKSSCNP
jgi:hypothetical protein